MKKKPQLLTAELLVEATAIAGRPPITKAEAQEILQQAVADGYLAPASPDTQEQSDEADQP